MSSSTDVQRHIRAKPGDVARYVLIPGDPGRAFYRRDDGLDAVLSDGNVVAAEQECASVFVVGAVRGVKVGAVLGTDSNILLPQQPTQAEKEALFQRVEATTITIAMRAVDDLHAVQSA